MLYVTVKRIVLGAGAIVLPVFLFTSQLSEACFDTGSNTLVRNRYIGVKGCKNCHKAKSKGAQFTKWETRKDGHAKAWEVLGTAKAKKVGAKLGVKDPQKSPKCLKCHVTAYGEKKRKFKRSFKIEQGVQCETCHGPGEKHAKTRFKIASSGKGAAKGYLTIPDDEIIKRPSEKVCLECHNDKSPSFKAFCFKERRAKVAHLDPRKKRTPKEIKALECKCGADGDKCECKQCECGGYEDAAKPDKKKSAKDAAPKK